ncbi:MAG: aldo/keto reductase [Chloroflexi bacterium]|nr:MAG: aldo/keto reductase [Chloroflexota bacterium]
MSAEQDHQVHRQPAGADPCREKELELGVDIRQHRDPGRSRGEQHDHRQDRVGHDNDENRRERIDHACRPDQVICRKACPESGHVFKGELYRRNLRIVDALGRFAHLELGTTVSRLAVAWTLANPAVQVAIVGTRNPRHIDDAIAGADLKLDQQALRRIDEMISAEVAVGGPTPESV